MAVASPDIALAIEVICALLTLAGLVYLTMALLGARSFVRHWRGRTQAAVDTPTISILKPMKGMDAGMVAALESQCAQQYAGRFEIIFGVSSMDDPAVAEIESLRAKFPAVPMRTIHCTERLGASGKVSNLVQMLPHALGEVIVVNDSDIRVSPYYLAHIAAGLSGGAGMVTMPYIGHCAEPPTLWAKLEALGIATEFFPSVLTARMLERGIHFALGSTLAMRREALEKIGGFVSIVDYLADDYELGARIATAGYRVELYPEVVETSIPRYRFLAFWAHQMRWFRAVRVSRPGGFLGLITTLAVPWALATCIASGAALWSFTLLSLALLARVAVALTVGVGILRDGQVLRDIWLLPLRDFASLTLWLGSYASDVIEWRGERFKLRKGKMVRVD
ncbi:MAG: bacteriohopanetetrol glucosamine biosynthesis glycosyltransferase HpnI [Acidobacteria bacterium]|nr:bacteriohopanetetrol glucosamine biosynthesis glycosyltransferase HpnI [Acidobacteriota bacterium]